MPDEPRRGGTGPGGDQAPQDDQPTGRRRRSLDGGGLSVSDLLEQHSRTDLPRPVPPAGGRRPAPEPEQPRPPHNGRPAEGTGRRAAPDTPGRPDFFAPEDTGTRPRPANGAPPAAPGRATPPANDFFAPTGEGTGTRTPRPRPDETGGRRARERHDATEAPRPANGYAGGPEPRRDGARPGDVNGVNGEAGRRFPAGGRAAEGTGRRARPEVPGHLPEGPVADGVGRRFADEPAAPGRRAADEPAPGGSGRRFAEDPAAPGRRAADAPRRSADAARDVVAGPQQPVDPRPEAPVRRPAEGPVRPGEHTGQRPHPGRPVNGGPRRPAEAAEGTGRRPHPAAPGPRPDLPDGPRHPGEDAAPGLIGRRLPDGPAPEATGRRARPEVPAHPGEDLPGRRRPDGSGPRPRTDLPNGPIDGPAPDGTGRRPRPDIANGPAEGTGRRPRPETPRLPDGSGPRPRTDLPNGPHRPVDGPAAEGTGRRPRPEIGNGLAEGTGRRPRPETPRLPDGSGPRPRTDLPNGPIDGPAPDGTGRRPRPEIGNGLAEGTGRRPRPEVPDGPRRLADGPAPDAGRRPVDGVPGRPGDDLPGGRLPDGSGPRRLADGPAPDAPGRRLADGSGPRRLAEGAAPDATGRRPRPEAPGGPRPGVPVEGPRVRPEDAEGPRRLADGSGPRPVGDAPGRRFAEDPAEALDQAPAGAIADRLGGSAPVPHDRIDPLSLTTEMEAISDEVKKRREVDHTLARFSAVHDELAEQERQRRERRQKLMPWKADHDEDATEYASPVEDPDEDRPRRRVRTAKHSKIVKTVKGVALTAAAVVFVSTGVGWGAVRYIDSKIVEVDALSSNSAAVHEAEKQLGDENFLIVGSDTRAGAKPQDGVGDTNAAPGARSDVLMLAHIPADRKRMVVVSVPRDLQVERPECEQWDPSTGQYTGVQLARETVKANQPYADGGPRCVAKFMTELTGLEINHFISIDFNGFKGMVDAVGAVTVCVPKPMIDDELGTIFDKPGKYDINGGKALDYVRARKVAGEAFGDYDRVTRQQQFLSALLRKALSSEILLNPGKLNGFLNAFASATVGDNIGVNDMLTLAQSLRSLEAGRVSFITVPHVTEEGPTRSNDDNIEVLKLEETKELFQAIIDGTPLPDEAPDTSAPADQAEQQTPSSAPPPGPREGKVIDPKGLRIQVRNGNPNAAGAAGQATRELEALGYHVVVNGNGPRTDKTIIKYHVGGEDIAATLKASVPGATLVADPSMGGAVELLIGPGWDGVIQAPSAGGGNPGDAGNADANPLPDVPVVNAGKDPCAG